MRSFVTTSEKTFEEKPTSNSAVVVAAVVVLSLQENDTQIKTGTLVARNCQSTHQTSLHLIVALR